MTSRSPLSPSQLVLPALSSTCPLSTMIVASPGLLCSVSDDPSKGDYRLSQDLLMPAEDGRGALRPLDASWRARAAP